MVLRLRTSEMDLSKKLIEWRKGPAIVRVPKPTNPWRARQIGYKAKQGVVVVRVRIRKSLHGEAVRVVGEKAATRKKVKKGKVKEKKSFWRKLFG